MSTILDYEKSDGLVAAIAQDYRTREVLMIAWMNKEAFDETLVTGRACYFSRSRNRLWRKGEESGNVQIVHEIRVDCDRDAVLLKVEQVGDAACHDGYRTCFYRKVDNNELVTDSERIFDPKEVYKK